VSDWLAAVPGAVAALAAADPGRRRFGAARHRYELRPPLTLAQLAAIEAQLGAALPGDLRAFAAAAGGGGAGPGYGVAPLDRAAAWATVAPAGAPWRRGLPVADLGCGYAAIAVLDGDARGEIWIDARAIGVVAPVAASFTAFYLDWVDRLSRARWPAPLVPPGACALAQALSGYLARCEARSGVAPGTLDGADLRGALSQLGPGAIAVTARASAWFADGDRVDPCLACARLVENLAADGLDEAACARGLVPLPLR